MWNFTATLHMCLYGVHKNNFIFTFTDRDSGVGRESHYRLNDPAFEPRWGKKIFLLDNFSDRPWGPPSLLYDGDRGPFPGLALTTHHHLAPRLKMSRDILQFPFCTSMACYGVTFITYYEVLMHKALAFAAVGVLGNQVGFIVRNNPCYVT